MVGRRRQVGRQSPRLVAEQPGDGSGEDRPGVVQAQLPLAVGRQDQQAGLARGRDRDDRVRARGRRAAGRRCRRWRAPSSGCRGRRTARPAPPPAPPARRRCGPGCRRCRGRGRPPRSSPSVWSPLVASASASGTSTNEHTATIPAGVTLSLREARARSSTYDVRGAAATSAAYRSAAAGVAKTSTATPRSIAASTAFGPSARNSRRSARTDRRLSLRASLTRGFPVVRGTLTDSASGRPQDALGALTSSGSAALAVSTRATNAGASLTARSARILRSTSTPARFRPWMNRL